MTVSEILINLSWLIIYVSVVYMIYYVIVYGRKRRKAKKSYAELKNLLDQYFELSLPIIRFIKEEGFNETDMVEYFKKARELAKSSKGPYEYALAYDYMRVARNRLYYISTQNESLAGHERYMALYAQLIGLDEKILFTKDFYNDFAKDYNIGMEEFPGKLFALIFGFDEMEQFLLLKMGEI